MDGRLWVQARVTLSCCFQCALVYVQNDIDLHFIHSPHPVCTKFNSEDMTCVYYTRISLPFLWLEFGTWKTTLICLLTFHVYQCIHVICNYVSVCRIIQGLIPYQVHFCRVRHCNVTVTLLTSIIIIDCLFVSAGTGVLPSTLCRQGSLWRNSKNSETVS